MHFRKATTLPRYWHGTLQSGVGVLAFDWGLGLWPLPANWCWEAVVRAAIRSCWILRSWGRQARARSRAAIPSVIAPILKRNTPRLCQWAESFDQSSTMRRKPASASDSLPVSKVKRHHSSNAVWSSGAIRRANVNSARTSSKSEDLRAALARKRCNSICAGSLLPFVGAASIAADRPCAVKVRQSARQPGRYSGTWATTSRQSSSARSCRPVSS